MGGPRDGEGSSSPPELFARVYGELRMLAGVWFKGQPRHHTLQPTALVHEAFLRIAGRDGAEYGDEGHLLATAARAMRQILVDHARARSALKRGGGRRRTRLEGIELPAPDAESPPVDVERLHAALARLESLNERQGQVVELRFFGGLTVEETARVLGVSPRTVKLDWQFARAWLLEELAACPP